MHDKHIASALSSQRWDWGIWVALLMALPLIIPFLGDGITVSADAQVNIHRTVSAAVNIDAGYLFPRWSPHLHHGFGYPIHNFYAPAIHMLGAYLMRLFALDAVDAYKWLQAIFTLLQPVGAYLFARTFVGRIGALAGAAAFIYAPFRFDVLWAQGNVSQMTAMGMLPWLFWAVSRTAQTLRLRWAGITAFFFGGIVLVHHASGFLVAPFIALYALGISAAVTRPFAWRKAFWPVFLSGGGLALGLCISAIFWLPALAEFRYVTIDRVQEGIFSVTANFVRPETLLGLIAPVDQTQLNHPRFFSVGLVQFIVAMIGVIAALITLRNRWAALINALMGLAFMLLTLYLMSPASEIVWLTVPIASLVVYPWRLLGIASLGGIAGAAVLAQAIPPRWRAWGTGAIIVLMFAAALPMLYAPVYPYDTPPSTPAEGVRHERATGNLGMTSANEYLPIWANEPPLTPRTEVTDDLTWQIYPYTRANDTDVIQAITDCPRGSVCYQIERAEADIFQFQQLYFPGWAAELDGQPIEVRPQGRYGLITLDMPSGAHTVRLWYAGTPIQAVGTAISLIAAAIAGVLVVRWRSRPQTAPIPSQNEPERGWPLLARAIAVGLLGFIVINQLWIIPQTHWLRPQSPLDATPIQTPVNVVFDDTLELLGYSLETPTISPEGTVVLRLHWRLLKPTTRELRAIVKLVSPDQKTEWANGGTPNIANINTRTWPTDRYGVDLYYLSLSKHAQPFIGQLRVGVYDVSENKVWPLDALSLPDGATDLYLTSVRITGDYPLFSAEALTGQPITFGDSVRLEGWQLRRAESGEVCLDARWYAAADKLPDLSVMLHTYDTDRIVQEVFDTPPFGGLYLTAQWAKGQTLDDTYCFSPSEQAEILDVALYIRSTGERLSAVQQGTGLTENRLSLSLP